MKFRIVDSTYETDGTHNQGTLDCTYAELVAVFGEPSKIVADKSRVSWDLKFQDGTIATIYDWKEEVPVEEVTNWMVGGHNINAFLNVRELVYFS